MSKTNSIGKTREFFLFPHQSYWIILTREFLKISSIFLNKTDHILYICKRKINDRNWKYAENYVHQNPFLRNVHNGMKDHFKIKYAIKYVLTR